MAKVWPGSVKHTAAPPVFVGSSSERKATADHERIAKARHEHDNGQTHDGGKLSAAHRNRLPKEEFGEPGERKYPMPARSHAANAKARASQMEHEGKLSESERGKIDAKADRILGKHR